MRRLAVMALLLLAPMAAAQPTTVTVRAGEHNGFTRLALILPAPGNWRFGRTASGYELRLDRTGAVFDLSRVFAFIRRDRLASLWSDPETGALVLGIACACHAVAYAAQPAVIVIDIRDGAPAAGSGFESAIDDPTGTAMPVLTGRPVPRPRARPAEPAAAPPPYDWRAAMAAAPGPASGFDETSLPAVRLREAIARQIGAASTRGLVDAGLTAPTARAAEAAAPVPAAAPRSAAPENLRVRPAGIDADDALAADGGSCVADDALGFLHDGGEPGFASVSALRSRLMGEFDRPDAAAALALAEAYLAIGFGAEARAVLEVFEVGDPRRPLLEEIARIIDDAGGGTLARMAACESLVAVWAVLDEPAPARGRPIAAEAVARAFSAMPPALRRHLGPRLADRLIAIGETATAHAIRGSLGRAAAGADVLALVDAGLSQADNRPELAERALAPAAGGTGPLAGLALARMTDATVDRGGTPDAATLLALAALAREQAGTPEGLALRRAHARGLAASGAFDEAFSVAADAPTRRDLWALLAARGSDGALLAHAVRRTPDPVVPAPVRASIADRLLELALPEAAVAWIDAGATRNDERLRAARAAVLARDGRAALHHLARLDGPAAELLRGEAAVLLGEAEAAAAAFAAAGAPDRAAGAIWRLRGWEAFGPGDARHLPDGAGALIAAATGTAALPPAPPTLAGTRSAIAAARRVRDAIDALLDEVGLPDADDRG